MADPSGNRIEPASATRRTKEPSENLTSTALLSPQFLASESASVSSRSVDRQNRATYFDTARHTPGSQSMSGGGSVGANQQARAISFSSPNENYIDCIPINTDYIQVHRTTAI